MFFCELNYSFSFLERQLFVFLARAYIDSFISFFLSHIQFTFGTIYLLSLSMQLRPIVSLCTLSIVSSFLCSSVEESHVKRRMRAHVTLNHTPAAPRQQLLKTSSIFLDVVGEKLSSCEYMCPSFDAKLSTSSI